MTLKAQSILLCGSFPVTF